MRTEYTEYHTTCPCGADSGARVSSEIAERWFVDHVRCHHPEHMDDITRAILAGGLKPIDVGRFGIRPVGRGLEQDPRPGPPAERRGEALRLGADPLLEWVARCLEGLGHEVIVADPNFAPMYATRTRKVKTDRRDARALADANLLGAYRPAHRLSDAQRHVRGRLGVRDALVRTRTRYISLIRALLRQHGYRVPSGSAEAFVQRVGAMALPGRLLSLIAPLLAVMQPLNRQLAYSDEVIEHIAAQDARVQRLRTVPSIGPVTAAAFVATLDDAQRFRHAHHVIKEVNSRDERGRKLN
jgi:transposase